MSINAETSPSTKSDSAGLPAELNAMTALQSMRDLCAPLRAGADKIDELQAKRNKLYNDAQANLRKVEKADAQLKKLYVKRAESHPVRDGKILEPLARALQEFFPGCSYELAGPFGIGCDLCMTFADPSKPKPGDVVAYGNFRFDMESMTLVMVDFAKSSDKFPANSIGAINGLNYETIEITECTDLAEIAQKMRY